MRPNERPFRFGMSLRTSPLTRDDWKARAREVEAMSYDVLLAADHLLEIMPPLVGFAVAAEATNRLRFGTFVLNNDFRHPALLAREVAAIDNLTDGRFELGIGAGHMASEYAETGMRFDPAATRVARLSESVTVLKRLLAGEEVTFEGEHYQLRSHRCFPVPVQQPVPLLIGGNGKRLLELAGREAQIVSFVGFRHGDDQVVKVSHFSADGLADRLSIARAAAGERAAELEYNVLVQGVTVTNDRRSAAEAAAERLPGLTADDVLDSPFLFIGTVPEMAAQALQWRERFGVSYFSVFEPAMRDFAPVIERLQGG